MKTWEECKLEGSSHYKSGAAEPIDVMKAKGTFKPFALGSIQKYAVRNMDKELNPNDIVKIIHYCELLLAENNEYTPKSEEVPF